MAGVNYVSPSATTTLPHRARPVPFAFGPAGTGDGVGEVQQSRPAVDPAAGPGPCYEWTGRDRVVAGASSAVAEANLHPAEAGASEYGAPRQAVRAPSRRSRLRSVAKAFASGGDFDRGDRERVDALLLRWPVRPGGVRR